MSGTHFFRSYSHLDSPLHRLSAPIKLCATLALVTGVALMPPTKSYVGAGLALGIVIVLSGVSRIPLSVFLVRLGLAQPFVLGIAVLALFQGEGINVFVGLALKSTASVAALQLLAHTTPFGDLLETLRSARVPEALVAALAILHRYLFVVIDEAQRMRRARAARTWQQQRWTSWNSLSSIIAVSFVRSLARAERIAVAMRARGGI